MRAGPRCSVLLPGPHHNEETRMHRSTRRASLAALALALISALPVQAQDYPNKPVKIIAPFPAGTGPDANKIGRAHV